MEKLTVTEKARLATEALDECMATAPPQLRLELIRYKAEMEGFVVQLREGGWSQGQIGAIVFDGMLNQGLDHDLAIVLAMEVLK